MTAINNNDSLMDSLRSLWEKFTVKRKSQLALITIATLITAILDLVSIGSIMPFISVIMDSEATFNNPSFNAYFTYYGYASGEEIILANCGIKKSKLIVFVDLPIFSNISLT